MIGALPLNLTKGKEMNTLEQKTIQALRSLSRELIAHQNPTTLSSKKRETIKTFIDTLSKEDRDFIRMKGSDRKGAELTMWLYEQGRIKDKKAQAELKFWMDIDVYYPSLSVLIDCKIKGRKIGWKYDE